jgi:hypothetical protein
MRGGRERPLTGRRSGMVSGWSWPYPACRIDLPVLTPLRHTGRSVAVSHDP